MGYHIVDEHPDDPRQLIPYVEFYITNVCNLNCDNCNRFNNHHFTGWQRWSDYEAEYEALSKHVRLQKVALLGGEPLLNPTILDWVRGINRIWQRVVQIQTNGTRLNQVPGLYELMTQDGIDPSVPWARNSIGVSLHNQADRDRLYAEITKFLKPPITTVDKNDPRNEGNATTWGAGRAFVDSNNVIVRVWVYDSFYDAAITTNEQGRMTLHNSEVDQAHNECGFVRYKCYHFIRGALYKCGPVALFPEFDKQFKLDISDEDRALINSYQPLRSHDVAERSKQFFATLDDPIPQCKFCPVNYSNKTIRAVSKKANSVSGFE
jgi:organic radical activating enzyme